MRGKFELKISIRKLILFIDVIIVLLNSGSAMKLIFGWTSYLLFIPLIIHFPNLLKKHNPSRLIPFWGIVSMIFITMIANISSTIFYYVMLLAHVIAVYSIAQTYSMDEIAEYYVRIITFLAITSSVFYYLVNNSSFGSSFPVYVNSNNIIYKFSILYVFRQDLIERNHSIFWEPGIFATMLIIAMIMVAAKFRSFDENIEKKSKIIEVIRLVVFSYALFTTYSSAGVILFGLFLLLFAVMPENTYRSLKANIGMWISVMIIVLLILNYESLLHLLGLSDNYFFNRITSVDGFMNNARYGFILNNWSFISKHPFIGYGIVNANSLISSGAGDTSTSLFAVMVFGILGVQYTVYFIMAALKQKISATAKFVLIVIIIFILNKEPHLQIMLSWLMLFSML